MPKVANNKLPKKNRTEERLRATPFNTTDELEAEKESIRLAVWRRFTEGQIIDELLSKPESEYLLKEWKAGLVCSLGSDARGTIYKIFSEGYGLKLNLNQEFTKTLGDHEKSFLEGIVRAGIEGYGALYMRSKSLIDNPDLQTAMSKLEMGLKKKS